MNDQQHEHVFGPFEMSRFTGNPFRRCQVDGCKVITIDPDDDDDEDTAVEPTQPEEE